LTIGSLIDRLVLATIYWRRYEALAAAYGPGEGEPRRGENCMAVETTPQALAFTLKTPLIERGGLNNVVAETESLWLWVKVYAEGGENHLHAHQTEDHAFIVLDGQATFHDQDDNALVRNRYEGVLQPRGAYYWFTNTGDRPLVLLRVGTNATGTGYRDDRMWPEGVVPTFEKLGPPTPIPGRFFGDDAT
jgi:mannose-6-phosphate isomerase-like protein (cupin superfamily)